LLIYMSKFREENPLLYKKIHDWLRKTYGKASCCKFCNYPTKRYEWALKSNCEYEYNVDNFTKKD